MNKQTNPTPVEAPVATKPSQQPNRKWLLGWVVLCGPICIILSVAIFRGTSWVNQQSEIGAKNEAQTHNTLGLHALEARQYDEAYNQFIFAIKLKPDFGDPLINLGNLYQATGDNDRAISSFNQALTIAPKKRDLIYNNLGMVYGRKGNFDEALKMFNMALESELRLAPIYRNIGQVYLTRKEYPAAVEAYEKVIEQKVTLDLAYREMLKDALLQMDEPELIDEANRQLEAGLGEADWSRYDRALVEYFADRDPKLADDYLSYAQALYKNGNLEKGIEACKNAIRIQPSSSLAHNRLGVLYASSAKLVDAEHEFNLAVKLDPKNSEALDNYRRCVEMRK